MKPFAKLIFCFLGIALSGVALAQTATFVPNVPSRFVDTKPSGTTIDGQFQKGGLITGGTSIDVPIAGRSNIPATGVGAVALNITVTNPASAGFLVAYPTGVTRPTASNLNFVGNQSISNAVIVKLGTNGAISLFLSGNAGSANVVVDVTGYFPSAAEITPLTPARLLDTRAGTTTIDSQFAGIGAVGPNGTLNLTVLGRGGVPSLGVAAVVLNVTATNTTAPSYITTWPTGASRPLASSINFVAGQTMPNLVIVAPGTSGQISLYNAAGSSDLVADVVAYFPSTKAFTPVVPARLLDTRAGATTIDGNFAGGGALATAGTLNFDVLGRGSVPATGVNAVALNVVVTGGTGAGFLTAWGTGTIVTPANAHPNAAMLTFDAAETISSLVVVPVGPNGQVSLYNGGGTTQVIADVTGWFTGPYDLLPLFESRNTSVPDTFYSTYYNDIRYAVDSRGQGNANHGIAAFIPCAPDTIGDPVGATPPYTGITVDTAPPTDKTPYDYQDYHIGQAGQNYTPPGNANNHGYTYDMTLRCAKPPGAVTLYRFHKGPHHIYIAPQTATYLNSLAEITDLESPTYGYKFDRAEGYVFPTQVDQTVPLYRLSLGATLSNRDVEHRYTVSAAARQLLLNAGWTDEGITGWVYPTYASYTVPANSASHINDQGEVVGTYNGTLNGIPLNIYNSSGSTTSCQSSVPSTYGCQITNVAIQNVPPPANTASNPLSISVPVVGDRYGILASNSTNKPAGYTKQYIQFYLNTGTLFGSGTNFNHLAAYLHYMAPATKDKLAGGTTYEGIGLYIGPDGQTALELHSAQALIPIALTTPLQNNQTYFIYFTLTDNAEATVRIGVPNGIGFDYLTFQGSGTTTSTSALSANYSCPLSPSGWGNNADYSYCGNPSSYNGFNSSLTGYLLTPLPTGTYGPASIYGVVTGWLPN